jgi:hypothetical protein
MAAWCDTGVITQQRRSTGQIAPVAAAPAGVVMLGCTDVDVELVALPATNARARAAAITSTTTSERSAWRTDCPDPEGMATVVVVMPSPCA